MRKDRAPIDLRKLSIAVGNVTNDNALDDEGSDNESTNFSEEVIPIAI